MDLALFTHGAYIWPVYRNFEAFIASLGVPSVDADSIVASELYPARTRTDSQVKGIPGRLDRRLVRLHRDLYDALLRPVDMFEQERQSFADYFYPELKDTALDHLFSAFTYFFVRKIPTEMTLVEGLNVLRAVFFSHEASDPNLWLQNSIKRNEDACHRLSIVEFSFNAPTFSKLTDLSFVVVESDHRPAGGFGWIVGRAKRNIDGHCQINVELGIETDLLATLNLESNRGKLEMQAKESIEAVFGWKAEGVLS